MTEQSKADQLPTKHDGSGWTAVKITEISALASMGAFVCGIAYDQAFLASLDTHLLNILSIHDSIASGVAFLPQIIFWLFLGYVAGHFVGKELRRQTITLLLIYAMRPLALVLNPFKKTYQRLVIRVQARALGESVIIDLQNEYNEKVKSGEIVPPQQKPRLAGLVFWLAILTVLLYSTFSFLHAPWSGITVLVAVVWYYVVLATAVEVGLKPRPVPNGILVAILLGPLIIAGSAIWGFKDAVVLQVTHGQKVALHLKDKPPNTEALLVRTLDAGVLLYDQEQRRLFYYPWSQVEHLEIARRGW